MYVIKKYITRRVYLAIRELYLRGLEAVREGNYDYARKLIKEAEEYRRSSRVKKPMFLKRHVCRRCYVPLIYGRTASIRLKRDGSLTRLVIKCSLCGFIHRYTIKRRRD